MVLLTVTFKDYLEKLFVFLDCQNLELLKSSTAKESSDLSSIILNKKPSICFPAVLKRR